MKVHFSNVNFSSRSGPNTFASRLADSLTRLGHSVIERETDPYDTFLAFIEPRSRPRAGSRFILRLDGIWFSPENYSTHNHLIKWGYTNCHEVIWQSQFDRTMTETWWGTRLGRVIGNGISLETREPLPRSESLSGSPLLVSSANWHGQKRLYDNVRFLNHVRRTSPDARLLVLGELPVEVARSLASQDLSRVVFLGSLPHDQCLRIFATADWMVHLAYLDHCPNSVVESLSQRCPVVCTDSGGTHEIVRGNGMIISETEKYDFRLLDYDRPPLLNLDSVVLPIRPTVEPHYVDIDVISKEYERVLFPTWRMT